MDIILGFLWQWSWVAFWPVATFLLLAFSPYGKIWRNETDRKRVVGNLTEMRARARYARAMERVLTWFDARLSSYELARELTPRRVAFSHDLIGWTMLLAVAYPALSIMVQWIGGSAMLLGGVEFAPAGTGGQRAYVAVWLGVLAALLIGMARKPRWRLALRIAAIGVLVAGIWGASQINLPREVAGVFAFAIAVAGAFTVAGVVAFTVAFAGAVASAGAVAVAFAVAGAVALLADWLQARRGKHPGWWLGYLLLLLAVLSLAVVLNDRLRDPPPGPGDLFIVLFFGVFPALNAGADFASVGLTRHLLRQGLSGAFARKAGLDILGGGLIFAALGVAVISYIHLVRLPDGTALLNLAGLFADLQNPATRGNYWWLAFMLASTLIPTLLHGMVAVFTMLLSYPAWVRAWVVAKLESGGAGSDIDGWQGALAYCAMLALSIWIPIAVCYWLFLRLDHGAILGGVIAAFAWYAQWIGAI